MSDRVKTIILTVLLTVLVAGIVLVTGLFVLGMSIEGSILTGILAAGAFLYLMFREEEAPPLVMHQSTWQTPEDSTEKED